MLGEGIAVRDYVGQIGRYRREIKLFLLYNLFANIGIGVFQLIYNLYLVQLSLREDFIGQYNALSTLAMACAALVMGVLLGRFGTWRCITYGTILFLVSSVALSVFATPSLILLFGVLAGAGTSFVFVPVMPFIVEWSRPRIRADVAALTFSLQSLATTVGSLVGGWSPRLASLLLGVAPQSVLAYRLALLAGVALAALALLPMVLMRDARGGHASESAQMPVVTADGSPARTRVDVAVFVLSGLLLSFGAGAVIPFYNVFLESIGARASQIGMIFSLAGIVAAFAGLFAPRCSRRFGPLGGALILRLAPVPAYALLAVAPSIGLAVVAQIVRTTSISMAWPIDSTFISEILPSRARANAFSLRSGAWNFGYALASLVAGEVIVTSGYRWPFLAFALFSVVSILVYVGYFRRYTRAPEAPAAVESEGARVAGAR